MPSGWEQSPDYGGREPGPFGWALIFALGLAIMGGVVACQQLISSHPPSVASAPKSDDNSGAGNVAPPLTGLASVIDGDTIEIRGERIRLAGIDAPEMGQFCESPQGQIRAGQRAALGLADQIDGRTVTCEGTERDRWGRLIADCKVGGAQGAGGVSLSRSMVEAGLAWAFVRYSREYVEAEAEAQAQRRGLWAEGVTCQPPWEWRR